MTVLTFHLHHPKHSPHDAYWLSENDPPVRTRLTQSVYGDSVFWSQPLRISLVLQVISAWASFFIPYRLYTSLYRFFHTHTYIEFFYLYVVFI